MTQGPSDLVAEWFVHKKIGVPRPKTVSFCSMEDCYPKCYITNDSCYAAFGSTFTATIVMYELINQVK